MSSFSTVGAAVQKPTDFTHGPVWVTLALLALVTSAAARAYEPTRVASMPDLLALSSPLGRFVIRDGFWTAGDGGAATFRLDPHPCVAPDGATRIPAASSRGCWSLVATGPVDVRVFGARCDAAETRGVWAGSDDADPLTKAFNSGLQVRLPSARACFVTSTVTDLARFADIGGGGMGMSTIVGGAGATPVLRFGDVTTPVNRTLLHDLSVTRADCGAPGTTGIAWASFNYAAETRVDVQCNAINRLVSGPSPDGISVEYAGDHIYSSNATQSYFTMADAAGVTLTNPEFGLNGGERFAVACQIVMTGAANALEIIGGTLIAQGPVGPHGQAGGQSDVLCFHGAKNAATVVKLIGVGSENYRNVISSDAATPAIGELAINGGRFGGGPTTQLLALDPATELVSFQGIGFETGSAFRLGSEKHGYGHWATLSGAIIGGPFSAYGPPRPPGTDLSIMGCAFLSNVILGGHFRTLLFAAPTIGSFIDLSTTQMKNTILH